MSHNLIDAPCWIRVWLDVKFPRPTFGVWAITGGEAVQVGTVQARLFVANDNAGEDFL